MDAVQVRIEGDSKDLDKLRRHLIDNLPEGARVQPISHAVPGELQEPVLVGLLIAVAPVALKNLRITLVRYMDHRERMEELRIICQDRLEEISLDDLNAASFES